MLSLDIDSTQVFSVSGLSDKELKEIETVLGTTEEIRYISTKGYGCNGFIQIEARYEDLKVFIEAVKKVTEVIDKHNNLWHVKEVDW